MMDEYIPSPRPTPNKPRRMRDVSALYPVDEKKLLLEALLKRQHESGPAGDTPPPRPRVPWRGDRPCPVCRWTGTSGSEDDDDDDDADQSDDPSARAARPPDPDSSSVSSDSADEDDDRREDGEGCDAGAASAPNEPGDIAGNVQELRIEDAAQIGDQNAEARDFNEEVPQAAEIPDGHSERESYPSPGKLLYGRHCLWYQSAGFVRPQGGK